jgi:hypothetical protein
MRQLCFAVACLALISCEDILPVENVDLCEDDQPSSAECPQCAGPIKPAGCPQCRNGAPAEGCTNASGASGAGNGGSSGQNGSAGDSGSGGNSAGRGAGNGGDSGTGQPGTGGGGASGGSGGSGMNAGGGGASGTDANVPECDEHSDCTNPTPRCLLGACVACVNNTACTGRPEGERCDERATSQTSGQCVACIEHEHCTEAESPQCDAAGQCVTCTGDNACEGHANATKCDTVDDSTSEGQCVQCLSDADCPDSSAPECNNHVCGACTSDEACTDRDGAHVCDLSGSAPYGGTCVECTVSDEEDCGGDVCTPSTRTCADGHGRTSKDTCQACVADSECVAEHRCIPMQFNGVQRQNAYCLRVGSTTCISPYGATPINRASVSGTPPEDYCGISESKTTCEAVLKLISNTSCPGGDDAACSAEGAICEAVNLIPNRCTYACTISQACPDDAPCKSGYCGGP